MVDKCFSADRLRVARSFAGFTQTSLAQQVDVSQQHIGAIELGVKKPNYSLLESIGEACGFLPDFFFGQPLGELHDELCHFRRRRTTPVSLRTRLLAHGTITGQLVELLDNIISLPPINVPEIRVSNREEIEKTAERCRMQWGLGLNRPVKTMTRVLENAGVVVTHMMANAEKVDAFSFPGKRSIVVLTQDKGSTSRSRFDMAHELGHLVMHGGMLTGDIDTEQQADAFASAFLLPRAGFINEFPKMERIHWECLFRLKQRWGVSLAALVKRAYDLRLLSSMMYRQAYKHMAYKGWLKGEPYEPAAEKPEIIPLAVETLKQQGTNTLCLTKMLQWLPETFTRVTSLPVEQIESNNESCKIIPLYRTQPA